MNPIEKAREAWEARKKAHGGLMSDENLVASDAVCAALAHLDARLRKVEQQAEPKDAPSPKIEVGDTVRHTTAIDGYCGEVLYVHEDYGTIAADCDARGIITRLADGWELTQKREDRPGDGFEHVEHENWGVGHINETGCVTFRCQSVGKSERHLLKRVYCARGPK